MNEFILALVRQQQKRQALAFKLRNLLLRDIIEGLSKSVKGGRL